MSHSKQQRDTAIVRRVPDNPSHVYEVICGARRHWTTSWMRANDYPEVKFLIEPRELTDEEAFRLADLENRSRRDLSDYERACDYARAVERYYGGSQQRMAERLEVTKSWLSRYLELAKLPIEVVAAFSSPHVLGIRHGATLAPLLRVPEQRELIISEAVRLRNEQVAIASRGSETIPPAAVLHRLASAAKVRGLCRPAASGAQHVVRAPDGVVIARSQIAGRGGGLSITLPAPASITVANLHGV